MFSSYQKPPLTVMISPLCTNCHDVTVILLNVALNTINLIFYLQRHIPTYLYIYIFMRIIDFIQFFASYFPILMSFKCQKCHKKKKNFVTESIFYKFDYFPKFSFSAQNVFLLSILQHVIASQSNHINTMLPNEMVLAPPQKLNIKYELSYQSTTRLKYTDTFDQLLITHQ
jgi:hypothetical protein